VVGSTSRQSDEPSEGRAVDDSAAALGAHLGKFIFHGGPYAAQVDRVDPVEGFGRLIGGVTRWSLNSRLFPLHLRGASELGGVSGRHAYSEQVADPNHPNSLGSDRDWGISGRRGGATRSLSCSKACDIASRMTSAALVAP